MGGIADSMTYHSLVDLKFRKGLTTHDLVRRYPASLRQINEIALMDIPDKILEELIKEEATLARLKQLKKRYSNFLSSEI